MLEITGVVVNGRKSCWVVNDKGGYRVMSLETGREINGFIWTQKSINDQVINHVHQLLTNEGQPRLVNNCPIFEWAPGIPINDEDTDIDEDDDDSGNSDNDDSSGDEKDNNDDDDHVKLDVSDGLDDIEFNQFSVVTDPSNEDESIEQHEDDEHNNTNFEVI